MNCRIRRWWRPSSVSVHGKSDRPGRNQVSARHCRRIGRNSPAPAVFGIAMRIYALNITSMSLRGKLTIGLVGCPDLLPDLWEMADEFAVGMEELLAHAR